MYLSYVLLIMRGHIAGLGWHKSQRYIEGIKADSRQARL